MKSLSFSSLGGGDAPPFSPRPPPWHHFLGSNVDLKQKNCSCQVDLDCQALVKLSRIVKFLSSLVGLSSSCQVKLDCQVLVKLR